MTVAGIYSLILAGTFQHYGQNGVQTNEFQLLVQETAQHKGMKELPAYVLLETGQPEQPYTDEWAQQDVFVAEAYGDYLCRQGGMDALVDDMEKNVGDDKWLLFTTAGCFEAEVLPRLDALGLLPQIVDSRDRYLSVVIDW